MPPPNTERRDRLAGAAIEVLAEEGSHGLTHRAVDTAAAVPPGTTSRYFRTRAALLGAVVDRLTRVTTDLIDGAVVEGVGPDGLRDTLTATLLRILAADRSLPLALMELHLEGGRSPHLRRALTDALTARRDLIVRQCRVAGVQVSEADATRLEMTVMGILFTALTVDPDAMDDLEELVGGAVHATLSRYSR